MSLFILSTISLEKKTEADLIKEWKISNIFSDRDVTYEEHLKFIKKFDTEIYKYSSEDNSYFTDLETAMEFALDDCGDVSEFGLFNYATIIEVPVNSSFARMNKLNIYILKYDEIAGNYLKVDINSSKETKRILKMNGLEKLIKK